MKSDTVHIKYYEKPKPILWDFSRTLLARSVPKPLKMPSLARSVAKPLKVPSLARSVPKPLLIELREAGGHQPGTYEPLLIFAADLLPSWSSR